MILTPEDICKAVGARAASERWLKDAQAIESALLEKLRGGVYEAVQCKAAINAIRARLEGGV